MRTTDPRFINIMRPALWRLTPEKLAELITYAEQRLEVEKNGRKFYTQMVLDAAHTVAEARSNPEPYATQCRNCGYFYTAVGAQSICLACGHHQA